MEWYYTTFGDHCYKKPLRDSDQPMAIGWLLYTSNFTDMQHLTEMLTDELKTLGYDIPVGGKMKTHPGCKPSAEVRAAHFDDRSKSWHNQPWMTGQLEVDSSHATRAKKGLYEILNAKDSCLLYTSDAADE